MAEARRPGRRVRARTARLVRIVALVTVLAGLIGAGLGRMYAPGGANMARSVLIGAIDGAALSIIEIVLRGAVGTRLRPLPVIALLGLKTLVYGAVFIASIGLASAIVYLVAPGMPLPELRMLNPRAVAFSLATAFAMNFVFVLRTILGPRTLAALVTGRYQQPRAEERIVMFLDLHGSTPLAERLGDAGFHRFLNRVFFDITDPVLESGGEIYRYVGDEIIISWRAAKTGAARRAIECLFAITDTLDDHASQYRAEFGAAPQLRGAIHLGPLVVGEMGDVKREIVMLGDTMNTAARIEGACRSTGRNAIASAALVRAAMPLPDGVAMESLGPLELRGKEDAVELFALSRQDGA